MKIRFETSGDWSERRPLTADEVSAAIARARRRDEQVHIEVEPGDSAQVMDALAKSLSGKADMRVRKGSIRGARSVKVDHK